MLFLPTQMHSITIPRSIISKDPPNSKTQNNWEKVTHR